MRLLYIFPRTTSNPEERVEEHRRRSEILQRSAGPGTSVDIRELENCPPAIESVRDAYAVSPGIISMAEELQDQYDGMIVGCFGDPAVEGAIEGTRIPIVGCALPSMSVALLLGQQFAVLSPSANSAHRVRSMVMAAGLLDRFAGGVALGIGVREFAENRERTLAAVIAAGRDAMDLGADVILLGCLSLAFTNVGDAVQEELGIPVVNPLRIAVRTCEMLVNTGLNPRRLRDDAQSVRLTEAIR